MAVVTTRQLLESGVHFGHQTRRWNPKMKRFIFTERNGIYIIDLQLSLLHRQGLRLHQVHRRARQQVLFVGTRSRQEAIMSRPPASACFVNQRWLGSMLTNFGTVSVHPPKE